MSLKGSEGRTCALSVGPASLHRVGLSLSSGAHVENVGQVLLNDLLKPLTDSLGEQYVAHEEME